jgi:hypothetical protein
MDLDKYINDNLNELILDNNDFNNIIIKNDIDEDNENIDEDNNDLEQHNNDLEQDNDLEENNGDLEENNEDLEEDTDDLYEQLYYKSIPKTNNIKKENEENEDLKNNNKLDEEDDLFYYFNLINIFTKYYNEKYDKKDNFFSGINDSEKDTSTLMELFFEATIEFKAIKYKLKIEDNQELFNYMIEDREKIVELFDKFDQVYCLELENKKIFTISLIICLNYIYENNILENNWKIFNLKER